MELGVFTFADISLPAVGGERITAGQRLRNLMQEVALAQEVGLDIFGVGEHHRPDFAISAPEVVLAAAAQHSTTLKLTSAVTILSTDDPVRVFQRFATVDLLSGGRAEIMVGRGSFVESFPLFGYRLEDYDELFSEKLHLLLELRDNEEVTWSGRFRPQLEGQAVYPRPHQERLPVWIAVGGTPNSVIRAATLGLPMALAIIGGTPERFAPLVKLYRDTATQTGGAQLPLAINSPTYLADTSQQAADEFYPHYAAVMTRIGKERGWPPLTRAQFDQLVSPHGAAVVGSPAQVVDKILFEHELFGHTRFLAQIAFGTVPHRKVMHAIELLGTKVAPALRAALRS